MKDIAKMCGVSIKTVSRVINGSPDVKEETREKNRESYAATWISS